jgi:hypothetical protein
MPHPADGPCPMVTSPRSSAQSTTQIVEQAVDGFVDSDGGVEGLWAVFELGHIRLVIGDGRLRVEPIDGADRLKAARQHHALVVARRRVLASA